MKTKDFSFADMIEDRLLALKTTAFAVEQAAGLPADAIRNVIRSSKKDGPTLSRAKEICDALGLEFSIGPKQHEYGLAEGQAETDFGKPSALRSGYLVIPWHSSAGRKGSAPIAFHSDWIEEHGHLIDHMQAVAPDEGGLGCTFGKNTVAVVATNALRTGNNGTWCYLLDGKT